MNGSPTKAQKDWHQWQIDQGCIVQGGMSDGRVSVHHIGGSKMKLKGVNKPGEWYTLCLAYWWHQDGRNPAARHINKKRFEREAGFEKELFIKSVESYEEQFGHKPMSEEDYQAIKDRA